MKRGLGKDRGFKELVVVRGLHPFETWPDSEKRRRRSARRTRMDDDE